MSDLRKTKILEFIQLKLKEKNIKQSTLGQDLNLKQSTISALLSGKTKISLEQFFDICEVIGERPQNLLSKTEIDIAKTKSLTKSQSDILYKSEFHLLLYCACVNPSTPKDVMSFDLTAEEALNIFKELLSQNLIKSVKEGVFIQAEPEVTYTTTDKNKRYECHKKVFSRAWDLWKEENKYLNLARENYFNYYILDKFTYSQVSEINSLLYKVYEKIKEFQLINQCNCYNVDDMVLYNLNILLTPHFEKK